MSQLFQPFTIKDVTFRNRVAVSPMCQYSARDGFPNDWHLVHLGARAIGGAGMVMVEATAVSPEGRISPSDTGLYSDQQVEPFTRIARFLTEHGAVAGIQLAHAGRKASVHKPWEGDGSIEPGSVGWETIAPSAIAFGDQIPQVPREMSTEDIVRVKADFAAAAERALAAEYELLEIHFAHGYLAHEFYSPLSNQRTDPYGGSFENRTRFLIETFESVREVWPERLPLIVRLSVTDWIEGGVTIEESIELTRQLKAAGMDLLDVSHGFAVPSDGVIPWQAGLMLPHAQRIRREAEVPTATSWMITEPQQAEAAVASGQVDLVMLARELLRDPHWPYHAARTLGVENAGDLLPVQYGRAVR